MRYVRLLDEQFIGDRTFDAGSIVPLPDRIADYYVNGKHGVIVSGPGAVEDATIAPAPERAVGRGQAAPRKSAPKKGVLAKRK